jgi:TetR/AcrR family transcriptional regulator, regulator of cefoperazone and chloramphenicol sensitivity
MRTLSGDRLLGNHQEKSAVMDQASQRSTTARKSSKLRNLPRAVHQKGQETRERILDAALKAFGQASFLAVTTRQISKAASVSLPTLQYYFGDKEGLYRACAEALVERYRRHTKAAGAKAAQALYERGSAETARVQLKALFAALGGFLVGSREASRWAQFVARELRDPGPAFEILYAGLWRPGIEITARLIARILGIPEGDPAARIRALLLISSLLAFQSGRSISLRTMKWTSIGPAELAMVLSGVEAQIDAIAYNCA